MHLLNSKCLRRPNGYAIRYGAKKSESNWGHRARKEGCENELLVQGGVEYGVTYTGFPDDKL